MTDTIIAAFLGRLRGWIAGISEREFPRPARRDACRACELEVLCRGGE